MRLGEFKAKLIWQLLECASFRINRMAAYPKPGWLETIAIEASHSKTDIFGTDSAYLRTIQYFLRRLPVGTALAIIQLAVMLPGKRQCCALQGALRPRCHTPTIAPRFSNGPGTHVRQPYFLHASLAIARYQRLSISLCNRTPIAL